MSAVDAMLFEDKLKNLVQNHACSDVALPTMTVTEKYAMAPGRALFDTYNAKNTEIHATWQTKINPDIFYAMEEKKESDKSQVLASPHVRYPSNQGSAVPENEQDGTESSDFENEVKNRLETAADIISGLNINEEN